MLEIFWKIWYFIIILPFLIVEKGYFMLNDYLERRGKPKLGVLHALLILLVFLLIILWAIGFR